MKYNMDQTARDNYISKHQEGEYSVGNNLDFYRFGYISLKDLKWLVENGFADPNESQNDGPTIEQFISWAETFDPQARFAGYAVGNSRDDYRITIDAFETDVLEEDVQDFFYAKCRCVNPDTTDRTNDGKYQAWWD